MTENNKKYIKIINEEITYEEDENGNKYKVVTKTVKNKYTDKDTLMKAIKKYKDKNKDKINNKAAENMREKYKNDPEFREKHKQRCKEYNLRKKLEKEETKKIEETVNLENLEN